MLYLNKLPRISYTGEDEENQIELEVDGQVERLPDDEKQEVIFIGSLAGAIYAIIGKVVLYSYIPPKRSASGKAFTRLKIKGTSVAISGTFGGET